MTAAAETIQLSKRFGRTTVLDGLDLTVPEGSIYALIGPNGSGKSTTIKILMNILAPTGGRAEMLGRDSRTLSPQDLVQIGYMSENQRLPQWMTIGYLLDYLKPFYPSWDAARCADLVRQFELPRDRKVKHLSRGMWIKTAITSALAYHPRLLLLDEPFSGLDPLVRDQVIEALLDSATESTVLISSHDLAEVESFASHAGYLEHGRLQFSEETNSLLARFRQVQVNTDSQPPATSEWPGTWLVPESYGPAVRFVDTSFDPEHTLASVRRVFGEVRDVSFQPMPLRAIFVAVAKASKRRA